MISNKPQVDNLLHSINKIRKIDDNGKVSFRGFDFEDYCCALITYLNFPSGISENRRMGILRKSLFGIDKKENISRISLHKSLNTENRKYLNERRKTYTAVITTNISDGWPFKTINFENRKIVFEDRRENLSRYEPRIDNLYHGSNPTDYKVAKIVLEERDEERAINEAIDHISILRGLWNASVNHYFRTSFGTPRMPVNRIAIGPTHLLYLNKNATPSTWYEPSYVATVPTINLLQYRVNLQKLTRTLQTNSRKSPHWSKIRRSLIAFSDCFDSIDYNSASMYAWSILENLAYTSNYNKMTHRVSSLYENSDHHAAILEHLRSRRNQISHNFANFRDSEIVLMQIMRYVARLIFLHMGLFSRKFQNSEDIIKFLDMPRERDILRVGARFIR